MAEGWVTQPSFGGPSRAVPGALAARHNGGPRVWGARIPNTALPVRDSVQRWIEGPLPKGRPGKSTGVRTEQAEQAFGAGNAARLAQTVACGMPGSLPAPRQIPVCIFPFAHGPWGTGKSPASRAPLFGFSKKRRSEKSRTQIARRGTDGAWAVFAPCHSGSREAAIRNPDTHAVASGFRARSLRSRPGMTGAARCALPKGGIPQVFVSARKSASESHFPIGRFVNFV
jgi:hypothetical protein